MSTSKNISDKNQINIFINPPPGCLGLYPGHSFTHILLFAQFDCVLDSALFIIEKILFCEKKTIVLAYDRREKHWTANNHQTTLNTIEYQLSSSL